MSFVRKAVVWLGLNEEYPTDDFAMQPEEQQARREARAADLSGRQAGVAPQGFEQSGPRPSGADSQRARPQPMQPRAESTAVGRPHPQAGPTVMPLPAEPQQSDVRVLPLEEPGGVGGTVVSNPAPSGAQSAVGTVRAVVVPKTTKPQLIIPKSFNDAQQVADAFKDAQPVIVNMQSAERDLARRLIDFSSGLCYGLGGQMERVAEQVYLLTPDDVEVDDEERQRFSS